MEKITDRKQVFYMSVLFAAIYMVSYITRINFGAVIAEIVRETGLAKSALSPAITGSFITYATGQIISGICGDKIPPKKLLLFGLLATALMNLLIPFCVNPAQMTAVWCINGFAQAFMWPPLVCIMARLFTSKDYATSIVIVSWGSAVGTILVYLLSPALIVSIGWRSVFVCAAAIAIIMALILQKYCINVLPLKREKQEITTEKTNSFFKPVFFIILIPIIIHGAIRDGISTWLPSYLTEIYNMPSSSSILSGVMLPIFTLACVQTVSYIYKKAFKSPIACAGAFLGVGTLFCIALRMLAGQSAAGSIIFAAVASAAMHGVNYMLISIVPSFFQKTGKVSTVSGILNSCAYIGSALSTYGIAVIAEMAGWNSALSLWAIIGIIGTAICWLSINSWRKNYGDK